MDTIWFRLVILAVVALPVGILFLHRYMKLRGARLVTCPETHLPVTVKVDAAHGAARTWLGSARIDLKNCTRWPEKRDCGQECLAQIEAQGPDCLVRSIVAKWYEGRECAFCRKPVPPIHTLEHHPGLVIPGMAPVSWSSFRPERLPDVFQRYQPVCWDCLISESFRFHHPEMVTERPQSPATH